MYEKIKHPTKPTTLVVDPPNPPKDKYHIHYKVCERDLRNLGKLSGLLHMLMKRYAFFNSEKLYIIFFFQKKFYVLTLAIFLSQEIPPSTESFFI